MVDIYKNRENARQKRDTLPYEAPSPLEEVEHVLGRLGDLGVGGRAVTLHERLQRHPGHECGRLSVTVHLL